MADCITVEDIQNQISENRKKNNNIFKAISNKEVFNEEGILEIYTKANAPIPLDTHFFYEPGLENASKSEIIQRMTMKAIRIGSDSIGWLNNYDNFIIRKWNGFQNGNVKSYYNRITNYINTLLFLDKEKSSKNRHVIYARNKETDQEESIMTLPDFNSDFQYSSELYNFIEKQNKEVIPINKKILQNWIRIAYGNLKYTVNPPTLSDKGSNASKNSFTLAQLQTNYAHLYKYKFSDPVILINPKESGINEEHKGKTVIFYNKFPSNKVTVNEILENYKGTNRKLDNNPKLGYIILDQIKGYNSIQSMLDSIGYIDTDLGINNNKFFMGNYQVDILLKQIATSKLQQQFKDKFKDITSKDISKFISILREENNTNSVIINFINKLINPDQLGNTLPEFKYGIFINPCLINNDKLKDSSIGYIDLTNNSIKNIILNNLTINGFNDDLVSLPRIVIKPSLKTNQDGEIISFKEFITPEIENLTENQTNKEGSDKLLDYTSEVFNEKKGQELNYTIPELLKNFNDLGITTKDLKNYIKNFITPIVLSEKSNILSNKINQVILNKVEC